MFDPSADSDEQECDIKLRRSEKKERKNVLPTLKYAWPAKRI